MATDYKKELETITREAIGLGAKLEDAEEDLKIDGKYLEACCVKHASLFAYYDEINVRLKYNLNRVKMLELQMKAEIFIYCKENYKKEYTDTAIKMVIDANPEYIKLREASMMIEEIYDRSASVVESFKTRSFDLNNIIRIREKEIDHVIIRTQ